jgi:hypothetical protein
MIEGLAEVFTRKFHSDNANSAHLRETLVRELHRK